MSETVYYRGVLTKVIGDPEVFAERYLHLRNIKRSTYHNNFVECLCDELYNDFFYHDKTKTLYSITKENVDYEDDIIRAERLDYRRISYELKYYNGGADFGECMEEALDKLENNK